MNIPRQIVINYLLYVLCLGILLVLPTGWFRLGYIHTISLIVGLFCQDKVRFYILLGMFHSAIHNLWPFLNEMGYDNFETSFYDVLCHLAMMLISYELILKESPYRYNKTFNVLTIIFLFGSVLNCIASVLIRYYDNYQAHQFFEYTTIFQAISTGYWISTNLWYGFYSHEKFLKHWLGWIVIMSMNWFLYRNYENLLGLSMQYKYVESVFVICTWGAAINNIYLKK